jgi:hypothetical protein
MSRMLQIITVKYQRFALACRAWTQHARDMKRSPQEILEEFFNGRPIPDDDLDRVREECWTLFKRTVEELRRRNDPLLKRAARLLVAFAQGKAQGRPAHGFENLSDEQLVSAIDWLTAAHTTVGSPAPVEDAFREAKALEEQEKGIVVEMETLRRYYRRGVKKSANDDARFAQKIDVRASKLSETGAADPLDEVLKREGGDETGVIVARRRYSRGKKALAEK